VEQQVHAADAKHGVIEVEAVEELVVEVLFELWIAQNFGVLPPQVFAHGHQEATRARRRIHHQIRGLGLHQLHHELDDVARRAELAVLPGSGYLAKHVFVEVALGVPILHGHLVDHVHHLGQQGRCRDGEPSAFHVLGVGAPVPTNSLEEGEDVVRHHGVHLPRLKVFEAGPAQLLVGATLGIVALREDAPLQGFSEAVRLQLFHRLKFIETPEEQQVGDLLDHLKRVGDPPAPEGIPDGVNLVANVACEHGLLLVYP